MVGKAEQTTYKEAGQMKTLLGLRAIPQMEYHRPIELKEALRLLDELKRGCIIITGSTDLVPAARRAH